MGRCAPPTAPDPAASLCRAELVPKTREVRVAAPHNTAQRWTLNAWAAKLDAQPGEALMDLSVRSGTHNRELWDELSQFATAFMRAAAEVSLGAWERRAAGGVGGPPALCSPQR